MTQEDKELLNTFDKELLLKDLCARLPYGVKVESTFINPDTKEHKSCGIEVFDATSMLMIRDGLGEFKPYLFPLSSMTEPQNDSWRNVWFPDLMTSAEVNYPESEKYLALSQAKSLDWLYKNHIDIRGLIEKGLAIDATNLNIY